MLEHAHAVDPGPGGVHRALEAHLQRLSAHPHMGQTLLQRGHLRIVDDHCAFPRGASDGRQHETAVVGLRVLVERSRSHPAQLDSRNQVVCARWSHYLYLSLPKARQGSVHEESGGDQGCTVRAATVDGQ